MLLDIQGDMNALQNTKKQMEKLYHIEKENAELKQKLESDELALNEASEIIAELKAQIEKMKCCGNCKHIEFRYFVENMQIKNITNYCSDCIRFMTKNKKDKWESAE